MKNGAALNNVTHLKYPVPSHIFILEDYRGNRLIDVNNNVCLTFHILEKGDYSVFVEKKEGEAIIHTTSMSTQKTKVKKIVKERQIVKRGFFKKDKEIEVEREVEEDGVDKIVRDYLLVKVNIN